MSKADFNAKNIFLQSEGDNYYTRNKFNLNNYISRGTMILDNFIRINKLYNSHKKILEIGCCSGYNLKYLCEKYFPNFEGAGVEPSLIAVETGNKDIRETNPHLNINLIRGTSDNLEFDDDCFDIVLIGFCLFWVDRKYLFKTIAEIDRVLKTGGFIILEDFDTTIPYIRENKHNSNTFTYKQNYSSLFLANPQYYLINKQNYSHEGEEFHQDIQERVSTCILFKDAIENSYQKA